MSAGHAGIDIRLIEEIEEATWIDQMPPASLVAPLAARTEAAQSYPYPHDATLDDEIEAAFQKANSPGGWLEIREIHAVQQLRGWHRIRFGTVTVTRERLNGAGRVLADLSAALDCQGDTELASLTHDPALYRQVKTRVEETRYCGECHWCWITRLRDEARSILGSSRR